MSEQTYLRLREFLDRLPGGYPATETGVEIRVLKKLFTPEEAEIVMKLGPMPVALAQAAEKLGLPKDEAAVKLEVMAKKGQLFRIRAGQNVMYMAMQFVVGFYEFGINRMDKETAELLEEYMETGALKKIFELSATKQLRVLPIEKAIAAAPQVAPYDQVRSLVAKHNKFSVSPCICRKEQSLLGHPCDRMQDGCLQFGPAADYYVENGIGRYISQDEVLAILAKAEEQAMVLSPTNAQDITSICCCCSCCCGVLRNLKKFDRPAEIAATGWRAVVAADDCTNCGACIERCQMDAIEEGEESVRVLDHMCIGCGLCVPTCPSEAMRLEKLAAAPTPPPNLGATMMKIMKERGLI